MHMRKDERNALAHIACNVKNEKLRNMMQHICLAAFMASRTRPWLGVKRSPAGRANLKTRLRPRKTRDIIKPSNTAHAARPLSLPAHS